MGKQNNRRVGAHYEERAIVFLENAGYRILEHNYRCKAGEVDIVAMDQKYLCFVEVKYRSKETYGGPLYAVNQKKQQRISKTAFWYLAEKGYGDSVPVRFDVVAMTPVKIELIKDAFNYSFR